MEETRYCRVCKTEKNLNEFCMNKNGFTYVCKECANKKKRETWAKKRIEKNLEKEKLVESTKLMRLADFTPRELMEELARRGYKGKLQFVQVQEIDIENF